MEPAVASGRDRQLLAILLIAGFVVTLAYAFYFRIPPLVDARGYDAIATNIATGHGYRYDASVPLNADRAISFVGPAYPYFVAAFYALAGHRLEVIWFVQALLHVLTAYVLYRMATLLFGRDGPIAGLVAVSLYLFCIDIIQMPAMIMTETVALFLTVLASYLFLKFLDKQSYINAALVGAVSALAMLTRPTLLLIAAIAAIFAISARRFSYAAVIIAAFLIVIAPWTIRNYITYDRVILTTVAGGYDLWLGNNPGADGGVHPTPEIVAYSQSHDILETSEYGSQQFKQFILHSPLHFAWLTVQRSIAYFSIARPYAFWFYFDEHPLAQKIVLGLSIIWSFLLFALGLAGAWLAWRSRDRRSRWIIALAASLPLSVVFILVETRYRLPIYPFLALFGGLFVAQWYRVWRTEGWLWSAESKTVAAIAVFCIAVACVDVLRHASLIATRLTAIF